MSNDSYNPDEMNEMNDDAADIAPIMREVEKMDFLLDVPMSVSVELGRTEIQLRDLLQIGAGAVLELNKLAGEPLEVLVNDRLVSKGEVVVVNEKYGIRLTDIIDPVDSDASSRPSKQNPNMKIVIQRALASKVEVDGRTTGAITRGMVLLVCMEQGDTKESVDNAVKKIVNLRVFPNPELDSDRMDLNINQIKGEILAISQFTLSWDGEKGNRPSFDRSMEPRQASIMFKIFCDKLRESVKVETGEFGEHMTVSITNDGPVTFSLSF